MWLTMVGASPQYLAGAGVASHEYATRLLVLASCIGTVLVVAYATGLSYYWRFPVPFFWVLVFVPWLVSFVLAHAIVTRGRVVQSSRALGRRARAYFPSFVVQVSQVVIYPSFSAAFEAATTWQQIALAMLFPVIKHALKTLLRRLSRPLRQDFAEEVAVSGVEICACIYQSMIVQTTPSPFATAFVIGVDLAQCLLAVATMLRRQSVVPQHTIVATALGVVDRLDATEHELVESELSKFASHRTSSFGVLASLGQSVRVSIRETSRSSRVASRVGLALPPGPSPALVEQARADAITDPSRSVVNQQLVLTHALEILQAAESTLLVEYLEVAIPVVSGIYLALAAQLPTAAFNQKLYGFYYHCDRLAPALESLALYTALQSLSLVLMTLVLRRRFQLASATVLAFHLERHAWSLQGKLVSWLACLLQFSVLHYGTDFSFRFKFAVPTPDS